MSSGVCGSVRPRIIIEYLSLSCTVFTSRFPKGLSHSVVLVEESLTRQLLTAFPCPGFLLSGESPQQRGLLLTRWQLDHSVPSSSIFVLFCFVYWTVPIIPILS